MTTLRRTASILFVCIAALTATAAFSQPIPSAKQPLRTLAESSTTTAQILSRQGNKATMRFEFAEPYLDSVAAKDGAMETIVRSATTENQTTNLIYRVPSFNYALQARVQSARIVSQEGLGAIPNVVLKFHPEALYDTPIGIENPTPVAATVQVKPTDVYPKQKIEWSFAGSMRGVDISTLTVAPYAYNPTTKTLSFSKKLTIELTLLAADAESFKVGLDEEDVMRQTPAKRGRYSKLDELMKKNASTNQMSAFANAAQTAFGKGLGQMPVAPKYRMIVKEEGVHRVGFFELQDAGFPNDFFSADPRTFRVFNKGREVPIYVKGEQDGRFNRDDYFEFIGEPNRLALSDPTRPDMYEDQHTDENVYYFYWEQAATTQNRGLRLVEISGESRSGAQRIARNATFRSKLHFEQKGARQRLTGFYYSPTIQVNFQTRPNPDYVRTRNRTDSRDTYFWDEIRFNTSKRFGLQLPGISRNATDSVEIKMALHGASTIKDITPQNKADIFLGNLTAPIQIGRAEWGDGANAQVPNIFVARLPGSSQASIADDEGNTVLQISNVDIQNPNPLRTFLFNWVEVTYSRLYRAFENNLEFKLPSGSLPRRYQFEIVGFTSPDVEIYKKGVGKMSNIVIERYSEIDNRGVVLGEFFRAVFQDDVTNPNDISYLATTSLQKKSPTRFEKVLPASLFEPSMRLIDKSNAYNYIAIVANNFITERDFNDPRNPLFQFKEFRESRLRALGEPARLLIASTNSIYDEFNNGIQSPQAIRDFLDYAYHEWQTPPTYVFLLGDAQFDARFSDPGNFVPTMHIQTLSFGATAADAWFTMVDGIDDTGGDDLLPEMQIARVPAANRDDIATYLAKLRRYETNTVGGVWKNRIFLIAGEADSGDRDDNKVLQTDNLISDYIDRSFFIDRLHTNLGRNVSGNFPQDKYRGGTTQLFNAFNEGSLVINFMGHGGGAIWQDSQLLGTEEVDRLPTNSPLPFITSFTCFVGAFDGIASGVAAQTFGSITLGERLILAPNRGAIGLIASAGLGWFLNDFLMAQFVYEFFLNERFQGLSIGDALFRAKTRYYTAYRRGFFQDQAASMIYQYNVFGDPAVRLSTPERNTRAGSPRIQWNLPSHIATVGERLVVKGTVQDITDGAGFGRITDQNNFEVSQTNIPFVVRGGRIGQLVGGQFVDSLVVQVPQPPNLNGMNIQNFLSAVSGGGQFKAYVQGANGAEVNGRVRFSTQAPFFRNVSPSENIRTGSQRPISFSVQLDARQAIQSVAVRCTVTAVAPGNAQSNQLETANQVFAATLPTTPNASGVFVTTGTIPAQFLQRANRVSYRAVAQIGGREVSSAEIIDTVGSPIDIAAFEQSRSGILQVFENPTINFYASGNQTVIGADAFNWSGAPVRANVIFYENSVNNPVETAGGQPPTLRPNPTIIGAASVQIPANGRARAEIPVPASFQLLRNYQIAMRVIADSASAGIEATYANNLSSQRTLTYSLLRVQNNSANTVLLDNNLSLSYSAGSFSRDGFMRVERIVNPPKTAQPDNRFMRFIGQTRTDTARLAYRIESNDSAFVVTRPLRLSLRLNPNDSAQNTTFIYRYAESLDRWLRAPNQTRPDLNTVAVETDRFGAYALMESSDITRPLVTLGIEGQQYVPGGFAQRRSRIVAVVQDQNGVYLEPNFVRVIRNGDTSATFQERLTIPQSPSNPNSVGVTYSEEFQEGRQSVGFLFYDANLNLTRTDTLRFTVEDGFRLRVFGSYPNPFNDKAYIAYEIIGQEQADDFEIKIYTASGRLISTYREPGIAPVGFEERLSGSLTSIGGKIIVWQGLDDKGNPVANGVYFAKIRISLRGRVLEETIKIARLQ